MQTQMLPNDIGSLALQLFGNPANVAVVDFEAVDSTFPLSSTEWPPD
jgi:hypothetical protein